MAGILDGAGDPIEDGAGEGIWDELGPTVDTPPPDPDPDPEPDPNPDPPPPDAPPPPVSVFIPIEDHSTLPDRYTVEVRDRWLNIVGPIDSFSSLTFTDVWMGVGGWVLNIAPTSAAVTDLLAPGAGIVVRNNGTVIYSGPVGVGRSDLPAIRRQVGVGDGEYVDSLVVSGPDDMTHIADRIALPNPERRDVLADYDVRSGAASTVMLAYIDANLGPSARAERRVYGLMFTTDPRVGAVVTGSARYPNLLTFLGELSTDVGVRVLYGNRSLDVTAYPSRNVSQDCVFALGYGNLDGFDYEQSESTADTVYVAGQGELASRLVVEATSGAVRRVEAFVDQRNLTTFDDLAAAANKSLREMVGAGSLTVSPSADADPRFGTDYRLGDFVTVVVDGVRVVDRVGTVQTTIDESGVAREVTVGSKAPGGLADLVAQLRRVDRRVGRLERI